MKLTESELKECQLFLKKYGNNKDEHDTEVRGCHFLENPREVFGMFCVNRDLFINDDLIADAQFAEFGSVPLHTDSLHGPDYKTFICFLYGKGYFSYKTPFSTPDDLYQHKNIKVGDCVIFDDGQYHDYLNYGRNNTIALIADIHVSVVKEITASGWVFRG